MWKNQEFMRQWESAKWWLMVNASGIILYLLAASQIWGGQNRLGLGAGDPIVWMLMAFPILVVFVIINTVWLILILRNLSRDRLNWQQFPFWLFGIAVWVVAYIFDWSME